jgi:lipoate-protein ligase A
VSEVEDLYDYSELRGLAKATMFVAHVVRPTLVLGGSQSANVVNVDSLGPTELRRRRGGGGLVLLGPKDLWVDWWIPAGDPRWARDVHASSIQVGRWWAATLQNQTTATVSVHEGPLSGNPVFRVVCFAGRGPGEVFVNDRKAVGVTQWRVREGVFLSTVLHAEPTANVMAYLVNVPDGLGDALDHQALSSLRFDDPVGLVNRLDELSGPWDRREFLLPN